MLVVIGHIGFVIAASLAAYALRFDFRIPTEHLARWLETLPYLLATRLILFHRFGLFRGYWRHVGTRDLLHLVAAVTLGSLGFVGVLALLGRLQGLPAVIPILDWATLIMLAGGARFAARMVSEGTSRLPAAKARALIIGAGEAGEQLVRQLLHDPRHQIEVAGLVDDDPVKHGRSLHGVSVVGGTNELRRLAAVHQATLLIIAIPSATVEQTRQLVARCGEAGVEFKILPPLKDLVTEQVDLGLVREVRIEDLLGREPVALDIAVAAPDIAGQVILVTGAGGSIGSELARQIARFHPRRLILLERAESPLYFIQIEIQEQHPEVEVVPVLASVTNAERLHRVFEAYRPDVVFPATASKHVPLLEWNVLEGVWNNVVGTLRMAQAAARHGTRKFVLISTDKAVNPASVLGATKRIAELIVRDMPARRAAATDFRIVRFGNVLGSDGSVVPLFRRQLAAGGPITVTHPEVQRYFMTIPEAVQLLLEAAALPEAVGKIAILEMGNQVRIVDLAEQLIRLSGMVPYEDVPIVFTGLRPGEKLLEELTGSEETAADTSCDKIRVIEGNGHAGPALARQLRNLMAVTARGDDGAVLHALTALVPEYRPEPFAFGHRNGHRPRRAPALRLVPRGPAPLRNGTHDRG